MSDRKSIELAVHAKADGYVSIGLSSDGTMHSGGNGDGSDITLLWTSMSGACQFGCASDQFAAARLLPRVDAQQSLSNVRAGREAGLALFTFERPLAASDAFDRAIDIGAGNVVIWSYHPSSTPSDDGSNYAPHDMAHAGASSVDWSVPGCVAPPTPVPPTPAPTPYP